jgi:hypothetical protein
MTKKKRRRPGQTPGRRPAGGPSGLTQPLRTQPLRPRPELTAGDEADLGAPAGGDATDGEAPLAPGDGAAGRSAPRGTAGTTRGRTSGTPRAGTSRAGTSRASTTRTGRSGSGSAVRTRTGASRRTDTPPGLFGFLRADSPYPRLGPTLGRGFVAVVGAPLLVVLPLLLTLAMWLGLVASGLDHVPQGMIDLLSIPPISSFFDLNIVVNIFGLTTGTILFTLGIAIIRSVIWAVLLGLVIESLDTGRATVDGARRGLRAAPTVLGILLTNVAVIFFSQILRFVLGASIGSLAFFGGLVGGLYFLAFAPAIAVREGLPARHAMGMSARAARLPGPRHLGMVFLYFSAAFFAFLPAGRAYSANPSLTLWMLVLAGTLAHLVFLAGFTHRYIVVKDEIPPPTPREARTRRRLFR